MDRRVDDLLAFLHAQLGNDRERAHFLKVLAALQPMDMKRELEDIARWIEREVEAKRRILDEYEEASTYYGHNLSAPAGELHGLLTSIKLLAEPYDDVDGYHQEWKP